VNLLKRLLEGKALLRNHVQRFWVERVYMTCEYGLYIAYACRHELLLMQYGGAVVNNDLVLRDSRGV
jgi:hypothetical protein